jgi:hypothetical protein
VRYRLEMGCQFPNCLPNERIRKEEYQEAKVVLGVRRQNERALSEKKGLTGPSRPRAHRSLPRRVRTDDMNEVIGLRPYAERFVVRWTRELREKQFADLEALGCRAGTNHLKGIEHGIGPVRRRWLLEPGWEWCCGTKPLFPDRT